MSVEIETDEVTFDIQSQNLLLITRPDRSYIRMENVDISQEKNATVAWLANLSYNTILEVQIKVK
jgi:hypothetical protein